MQWVVVQGKKRFGLAGFNSFPRIAFEMFDLPSSFSPDYDIILTNSRAVSRKLFRVMGKNQAMTNNANFFMPVSRSSKNSRYSFILTPNGKDNILFIDVTKTRESAIRFLIVYLNHFFDISSTIPIFDPNKLRLLAANLSNVFETYNKKFGITFSSINKEFIDLARNFYIKFRTSYIDYLTLKQLSSGKDFDGELSDFISGKIELLFTLAPKTDIFLFLDTLNVWGLQTEGFNFLIGLYAKQPLYLFAKNKFHRENTRMLNRYAKQTDLVLSLEKQASDLELQSEYTSFDNFIEICCKRLETFVGSLGTGYVWLQESVTLIQTIQWYEKAITETRIIHHPRFGSVDNFIKVLMDIFYKGKNDRSIYPENSIIAGYGLVNFLRNLLLVDPCEEYVEKVFTLGPEVTNFIISSHDEIKRKNPESRFLDYEVPALILTGLIQVCINHKKFHLVEGIILKCEELGERYDLAGILVTVYWTKFLFYQDYEALLKVYKLHPKIVFPDSVKEDDFEVLFRKIQALVSAGVFEEKQKFQHYSDAVNLAMNFPFSSEDVNSEDLFHQRMSGYIAQIFYFVEKAILQESIPAIEKELKKANPYAMALESEVITKADAANIFAWKTRLLVELLNKNNLEFNDIVQKIEHLPFKSQTTELFLVKVKNTLNYINDRESNNPLNILDLPIEKRDPWSRLLEKMLAVDFKTSVQDRLKFFSKAILLMEGPTEINVFPVWANTLGFDFKKLGIGIDYLSGASKAKFHLRFWGEIINSVKMITNKRYLPIYLVLDLNAKCYAREAISEGVVLETNCFILSMGDIEDYYPIDVLTNVLEEICGKKPLENDLTDGRAHAIDHFLKKNGYYDDWKIPLGIKVAKLTPAAKIPAEIQNIIKTIAKS
jgi:hypothetical protein